MVLNRWWRRSVAVLVFGTAAVVGTVPAAAAGGTWGAGHYVYADGRVCRTGAETSPLAAWAVSGGHRAYLTQALRSDGRVDSAAPPIPSAGTPQAASTVGPGGGFPSEQDIAALAYLLDHGGDAAALATVVLADTDPGGLPNCADATSANEALAQGRLLAGPYKVTVSAPAGRARPGTAVDVQATVRTTAGDPVPGAKVTFTSDDANAANAADPTSTTDGSGTAHAQFTVHDGAPAGVAITATTAVPTGLLEAVVTAAPSATNPSGASVPAVYPAPPTTYSGQASIAVDQSAHPVVSSALDSGLVGVDTGFVPHARITGLNGHSADVTFDLLGPLPLKDHTLCAGIAPAAWKSNTVHVASTDTATAAGDGTVDGSGLSPNQPGCFALRTTVATIDATPAVVRIAPLAVVAALDTTVTRTDDQPAVATLKARAPITGTVRVGNTHGLTGTVRVTVIGPIRPADGNCGPDAKGWDNAPRQRVDTIVRAQDSSATAVAGAGAYDYAMPVPDAMGCYRAQPYVTLTGPAGDRLSIAAADARAAYVLDPAITATVDQTWSVTPAAVPVSVQVAGLFGLAAHVHVAMYVAAAQPDGCTSVSFAHATRVGDGPDADVPAKPGVQSLTAQSGPTPKQGCYAAVPELTLDANPRVQVAGPVGTPDSTLIAGIDPTRHLRPVAEHESSGAPLAFVVAMSVLGGVLVIVVVRVLVMAWRERDGSGGWTAPRDVDRLGLEEELPSRA